MPQFGDRRDKYFPHPCKASGLKLHRLQRFYKCGAFELGLVLFRDFFFSCFGLQGFFLFLLLLLRGFWELSTAFIWCKMKNFFHFIDPFQCSEPQIMGKETQAVLYCQSVGPRLKQSAAISTISLLLLNFLFSIFGISESSTQKTKIGSWSWELGSSQETWG